MLLVSRHAAVVAAVASRHLSMSSSVRSSVDVDVVVSGGGLVGGAMALAIRNRKALQNKAVMLVEGAPKMDRKSFTGSAAFNNRVVALNNSSRDLFVQLGLWQQMEEEGRIRKVQGMHVWEKGRDSNLISFSEDLGKPAVFYIVENDLIVQTLMQHCTLPANDIEVKYSSSVTEIRHSGEDHDHRIELKLKDGSNVTTKLLIGADGANSLVRKSFRASNTFIARDYEQMGLVAILHFAEPIANSCALQKFLPGGPIALLPLQDDKSALIWTLPTAKAKELLAAKDPDLILSELVSELGKSPIKGIDPADFPKLERLESPAAFPLALGHSSRYVKADAGLVLVGDAAHRVHPMAGQGVNLGFGDVYCLSEKLSESVLSGSAHFPASEYLLEYESERQRQVVPMMVGIDMLQRIYSADNSLMKAVRGLGIAAINSNQVVKRAIGAFPA